MYYIHNSEPQMKKDATQFVEVIHMINEDLEDLSEPASQLNFLFICARL